MSEQSEVTFTDEQKKVFQRELAAQSGKPVILVPTELMTLEQKAIQARETGDFAAVKKDMALRNAFLQKFGVAEFGKLQQKHLQAERERKQAEERERLRQRRGMR